jgi:hypothetical protein
MGQPSEFQVGGWRLPQVPFSHRDARNPRAPADGVNEYLPIPGELQVSHGRAARSFSCGPVYFRSYSNRGV